jgi:guanylate kinase
MRQGERNGVDYHFVTKGDFLDLKAKDFFIETTEYNGNFYGTSKPEVADNKVLIVETSGARVYLSFGDPRIILFRLIASNKTRAMRMAQRGDNPNDIEKRLENDVTRFADSQFKDERIIDIDTENLSIPEVATKIYSIYQAKLKEISSKDLKACQCC